MTFKKTSLKRKTPLRAKTPWRAKPKEKAEHTEDVMPVAKAPKVRMRPHTTEKREGVIVTKEPKVAPKEKTAPKKKRKVKTERQKLIEKLDRVFSQYIRLKEAIPYTGMVQCFTSGKWYHWTEIQNGHHFSRGKMSTRFNEMNCHPQSVEQNIFEHGNQLVYRDKMVEKYGLNEYNKLKLLSNLPKKWHEYELTEMIKYYTALVEHIRQEKHL